MMHSGTTRQIRERMIAGLQRIVETSETRTEKLVAPEFDRPITMIMGPFKMMGTGFTLTLADKVVMLSENYGIYVLLNNWYDIPGLRIYDDAQNDQDDYFYREARVLIRSTRSQFTSSKDF